MSAYPIRVLLGHIRLFVAAAIGLGALALLPHGWTNQTRFVVSWDIFSAAYLVSVLALMLRTPHEGMAPNAARQQDAEWTLFWIVLAGASASFAAIVGEFRSIKDAAPAVRDLRVGLVIGTIGLSWLLVQAAFALRYAHEFYSGEGGPEGGLEFPKEDKPDYLDFMYFSAVLGMTFQVSDVEITSRKLRRLATAHGLLGFLFNTVIIALTVNLASGLLG